MTTDKKASAKSATATETTPSENAAKAKQEKQEKTNDGIELLKTQHREIETLLATRSEVSGKFGGIVQEIAAAWIPHTVLEEDVLEPAALQAGANKLVFQQAQVRRDLIKLLLADLLRRSSSQSAAAKLEVLAAEITALIAQEENPDDGLIAAVMTTGVDMADLGEKLQSRHAELQQDEEDAFERLVTRSLQFNTTGRNSQQESEKMPRQSQSRDRDENGRFMSDDDDRGYGGRGGSRSSGRDRDEYGRFASDDDDDRGRNYSSRGRGYDDDDDRGSRNGNRNMMRDDDGRFSSSGRGRYDDHEGRGWYGDSEGHSEASRRGWESRGGGRGRDDDDDDRGRGRSRDDDDDGRGRGHGGWFGDSEGHSRAASQRGRSNDDDDRGGRGSRSSNRSANRDDDGRFTSSSRGGGRGRNDDDDDNDGRGWYGDSRGHAEAARRGWEDRDRGSSRGGGSRNGGNRSSSGGGSNHGGWFGDSRGHAEAARRGWEDRR